jgi:cation/acetate symporter
MCAIFVSFTYVAGQMRGVGVVFSRFLEVDINAGVVIGMGSCSSTPCWAG